MKTRTSLILLALGVLALVAVQPAPCSAGFIGDTAGNTVTATADRWESYAPPSNLVDGSGMSDSPVLMTSKVNSGVNWAVQWLAAYGGASPTSGYALFTFTKNTSLDEIVIWNAGDGEGGSGDTWATRRGMKAVTITCSTGADTTGTGTSLWSGNLTQCTWPAGGQPYTDDLTFTKVANVKAVKIAYTSNWGGDYVGLS
ncbi:MAG TPA: hypothetical protein VFH53_07535, partial [Phycisphaerae bacterium]|nr:hypothetical protein [Phycisphaerae bacterium]